MKDGIGGQLIGGMLVGLAGILVIAGIYQLNKKGSPIVPAVSNSYQSTLTSVFK